MPIVCQTCDSDVSPTWWKCCPKHTTERGRDVVCQNCANDCFNGQEVVSSGNEVLIGDFTLRDGSKSDIYVITLTCISCKRTDNVKETPIGALCVGCILKIHGWIRMVGL